MKRTIFLALALMLLVLLTACGAAAGGETAPDVPPGASEAAQNSEETGQSTASTEPRPTSSRLEPDPADGTPNILIAYFSCSGNTRQLAEFAADALGADLYEIVPETPYTSEDLHYQDASTRAALEQNDASARPQISGPVPDLEAYDIVFLGYPIWFGQAPRIISTFLERCDFSGKTIVPFCTSGSSGVGTSDTSLYGLCSDSTTWVSGTRFAGGTPRETIEAWIRELDLGGLPK